MLAIVSQGFGQGHRTDYIKGEIKLSVALVTEIIVDRAGIAAIAKTLFIEHSVEILFGRVRSELLVLELCKDDNTSP